MSHVSCLFECYFLFILLYWIFDSFTYFLYNLFGVQNKYITFILLFQVLNYHIMFNLNYYSYTTTFHQTHITKNKDTTCIVIFQFLC